MGLSGRTNVADDKNSNKKLEVKKIVHSSLKKLGVGLLPIYS